MKAWAIFVHSIRQVFGNLPQALQVSGLLYLAQMAVSVALGVNTATLGSGADLPPERAFPALIALLLMLVTTLWIAVAWHRYVLLNERPAGLIPVMSPARLGRYLWRSILIGLVAVALVGVISIAAGGLLLGLLGEGIVTNFLIVLAVIVPVFTVLYRLSSALPGLALDRQTGFADGWVATTGETETILMLAFFTALVGLVLGTPLRLMPTGSLVAMLWELAAGWVQLMVSASILTTLYGHYIEKRPLV